jgi:hypothetical protein
LGPGPCLRSGTRPQRRELRVGSGELRGALPLAVGAGAIRCPTTLDDDGDTRPTRATGVALALALDDAALLLALVLVLRGGRLIVEEEA